MSKAITTRDAVRQLIEQAVGLTHPTDAREKNPAIINEPAPNSEAPIVPFDARTDQEIVASPPIDDEEYMPVNLVDLGKAAQALAIQIPAEMLETFYKDLRRLVEVTKEKQKKRDEAPKDNQKTDEEETDVNKVLETKIRLAVRKILSEGFDSTEQGGYEGTRGTKKKFGVEMSLDAIAKELGFGAASGARQLINLAGQKAKFIADMPEGERGEIVLGAAHDYIEFLLDQDAAAKKDPEFAGEEGLTKDDAQFLRAHPEHIMMLDGFKEFLRKYWNKAMRDAGMKDQPAADIATMKTPAGEKKSPVVKKSAAEIEKAKTDKADAAARKKSKMA